MAGVCLQLEQDRVRVGEASHSTIKLIKIAMNGHWWLYKDIDGYSVTVDGLLFNGDQMDFDGH